MVKYTYVTEKVEDGRRVEGEWSAQDGATDFQTLGDLLHYLCGEIDYYGFFEGDITEIKATRDKDGSILVAVTGNKDRIFSKIRRGDGG